MIVICVEGCHGCGKTKVCEEFEKADFWVLDEGFMDMPEYALHPQSLLMETTWVCSWFTRLLKKMSELKKVGAAVAAQPVFVADRSPFSAAFYSRRGGDLLPAVIREQIQEVREAAGIEIYTVYLQVDEDVLWGRITNRLKDEPARKKYDEDKREWMDKTVRFYETFDWDVVVKNNQENTAETMQNIIANLAKLSPRLRDIMLGPNRPGKDYFKKRLGVDSVLNSTQFASLRHEGVDVLADEEAAKINTQAVTFKTARPLETQIEPDITFRRTSP